MRILQLMAGGAQGGAELFFERLTMALARRGMAQQLAIRENAARADRLRDAGLLVSELPFGGKLDFRTRFALRRQIADFDPDIVLSWMSRASDKLPGKDAGARPVYCARLGGYYPLKYYRKCDHLIGNTPDIVDYLVHEGWPEDKAHYLPNFVSAGTAPPLRRDLFSTPEKAPLLLAMGRLHRNKAFDVLLTALAALPDCFLWLAGDGPEKQSLQEQAHSLGVSERVRFLGWREDGAALCATADIFVCPSRIEPLGNVVIEAWAQRLPVVAARAAGPEFLITDEEDGLLARLEDASDLARAIRRLVDDPVFAKNIAERGYGSYVSQFTEDVVVDRYLQFFAKVVV